MTEIEWNAFSQCQSLTSVIFPDSVTEIGACAFYGCTSLTSVIFPDSVIKIGGNAFYDTPWLKNYPNDFVIGGKVLIKYKGSASSVTISDSVTMIGNYAFEYCERLTSVNIPDNITIIGDSAFHGCESLTSVIIPDSVKIIGDNAFSGCMSLTSVTIPDSVKIIGDNAFSGCESLTSVIIPDSVRSIGYWAFDRCIDLTSITICNSTTEIGEEAFDRCTSLDNLFVKGYHIHGNFGAIHYFTKKLATTFLMLNDKNFSVKLESAIKYPFILAYYRRTKDETALTYIKKQFSRIVTYAIEQNDIETIEALTAVDNLFTKKNIDKLIQTAIDKNAHEIYVILLNYKNEHIGYADIDKRFKL